MESRPRTGDQDSAQEPLRRNLNGRRVLNAFGIAALVIMTGGLIVAIGQYQLSTGVSYFIAALGGVVCAFASYLIIRYQCPSCGRTVQLYARPGGEAICERCEEPHGRIFVPRDLVRLFILTIAWVVGSVILMAGSLWNGYVGPGKSIDVISPGPGGDETCFRSDTATVRNNAREVAVVRAADCPADDFLSWKYDFFVVFVHRAGDMSDRSNVVLQYIPYFDDVFEATPHHAAPPSPPIPLMNPVPAPSVRWIDDATLEITTPGKVDQLLVLKHHIDGIKIRYRFPAGPPPPVNRQLLEGYKEIR